MPPTPPGWYPDPSNQSGGAIRYWDGNAWTQHVAVPSAQSGGGQGFGAGYGAQGGPYGAAYRSPYGAGRQQPYGYGYDSTYVYNTTLAAFETEGRRRRWAQRALTGVALCIAVTDIGYAFTFSNFLHTIATIGPGTNQPPPGLFTHLASGIAITDSAFLIQVVVAVFFIIWQYEAAQVARNLGFPARVSPGLGAASWFIPIGSLWLPYWSLADLLPPAHPARAKALPTWLLYIGTQLLSVITAAIAIWNLAVALIPGVALAVCLVMLVRNGRQLIDATFEAHTDAMARLAPATPPPPTTRTTPGAPGA